MFLAILTGFLAAQRLHSSGVCGKSGVYAVTPERNTPVPDSAGSHPLYATASPRHAVGGGGGGGVSSGGGGGGGGGGISSGGGGGSGGGGHFAAANLPGFTLNQR